MMKVWQSSLNRGQVAELESTRNSQPHASRGREIVPQHKELCVGDGSGINFLTISTIIVAMQFTFGLTSFGTNNRVDFLAITMHMSH